MIQTQGQSQVQILGYVFGISGEVGEFKLHGFHIHENPCTPDDCQACGGHYNPFGVSPIVNDSPFINVVIADLE